MQLEAGANAPAPVASNSAVPVGVPGLEEVSVTVAVQVVGRPEDNGLGSHAIVAFVSWSSAPTVNVRWPALVACTGSPPYSATTIGVPAAVGLYLTEHAARSGPAEVSVQLAGSKGPGPPLRKVTLPPGVLAAPAMSTTVAVHSVCWPALRLVGAQASVEIVVCRAENEPCPLLAAKLVAPA